MPFTVSILLFPDVELLDAAGPYEVFSTLNLLNSDEQVVVTTFARNKGPVKTANGMTIYADESFDHLKVADLLILPGGTGTRSLCADADFIKHFKKWCSESKVVLSVCTGARVLAKAGLLDGLTATTHHSAIDELRKIAPITTVVDDKRFIDNGKFVIAAGVSSGIDASLYIIKQQFGANTAQEIARYIEWKSEHDFSTSPC